MAFTQNPQFNTYQQKEVTFDGGVLFRSGDTSVNRDIQIVNMYYDRASQENKTRQVRLRKRPGLTTSSYSLSKAAAADVVRGSYYDVDQNAFYWAVGDKLYSVTPDVGTTVRTVATLNTSSGYVGFCSFLKADDTRYVLASDGTDLWVDNFAAVSCARVTDAQMPTPHKPFPIYLNGYVFLIEANSGNIWNSDNDDPTAWTAGSYITAEISSDYALRMIKAKNYLVVLGANSAEYFWDAGNASGSPLSRNDSPVRGVGYVTGLCTIGDITYFVGHDERKNLGVYSLNSFKIERVSSPIVDRTLETFSSTSNAKGNVTLNTDGYPVSIDGHTFYALVTEQTTWMYDVDDKLWYEWEGSDNTGLKVEAVWGMFNGGVYVAIEGQTYISILSPSIYQDFGSNFTCHYITEPLSFDTPNQKTAHRLYLHCSQHTSSGTSTISVAWSDNDWASTSGSRTINVFSPSPFITRLGKFRTRSFQFSYQDNYPLWMTGMTLNINVGTH